MLTALLKTMRPRQWPKNIFIFAAIVFDKQLLNVEAFLRTLAGFVLFCLISSSVYIFNDLADVEADRQHPDKKNRPIAAGKLPANVAWAAGSAWWSFHLVLLSCSHRLLRLYLLFTSCSTWPIQNGSSMFRSLTCLLSRRASSCEYMRCNAH